MPDASAAQERALGPAAIGQLAKAVQVLADALVTAHEVASELPAGPR